MRRVADLGVAPTTAIFLKPRFAAAGSDHEDVSCVVAAHDASAAIERAAMVSRVVVLSFMESIPPLSLGSRMGARAGRARTQAAPKRGTHANSGLPGLQAERRRVRCR